MYILMYPYNYTKIKFKLDLWEGGDPGNVSKEVLIASLYPNKNIIGFG